MKTTLEHANERAVECRTTCHLKPDKAKGCPKGVEPSLPASQAGVQNRYTTDTMSSVRRPGFEPGTPRWKRGVIDHFTIDANQETFRTPAAAGSPPWGTNRPRRAAAGTGRRMPKRKAWDLNPYGPKAARFSKPARQTVSGYLPGEAVGRRLKTVGRNCPATACCLQSPGSQKWSAGESNPDCLVASQVSSR